MKNLRLKIFLTLTYIISITCFIVAFKTNKYIHFSSGRSFSTYDIIIFILLSTILESFIIMYGKTAMSTGFVAVVSSILYFDVFWSMVIISVSIALRFIKKDGKSIHIFNTPLYKTLFNISAMSISIFVSGMTYYIYLATSSNDSIYYLTFGFMTLVIVYLLTNTFIISSLISIWSGSKFSKTIMDYLKFGFLDTVFVSPFGVILFYLYKFYGAAGAVLLLIPIVMLRYVFKLYTD